MPQEVKRSTHIPCEMAGLRLDRALAALFPDYSRMRLQQWIRSGCVKVDRRPCQPRDRVQGREWVEIQATVKGEEDHWQAQPLALEVVYEDPALLVINKPPGLVMHPGAGNPQGTLLNALLARAPDLAALPRAGLVHRLDKDTSGLVAVARTPEARESLIGQLQARALCREYEAVVKGVVISGGCIEVPVGRHPVYRTRMAVVPTSGKPALTHYRVVQRFRHHTHLRITLETGRTHQIRVHLAHIRHPVEADPVYGGRLRPPPGSSERLIKALRGLGRQALHATTLGLIHPETGEAMQWSAPPPADLAHLLRILREEANAGDGRS